MAATVQIGAATVIRGDCLEVLPGLGPVDAIVTDPPYHLGEIPHQAGQNMFVSKEKPRSEERRIARTGFMGKNWDGGDIAFRPETWAAMLPALKPGGYLLAFGGTRTHHRVWCAIEDAGFVIQDTISWLYGQGFPKGRTQLKPAWEPICVAYKPGRGRVLQIDEGRVVGTVKRDPGYAVPGSAAVRQSSYGIAEYRNGDGLGRWPANLCHDGSDEVMAAFAAFGDKKVNRNSGYSSGQCQIGTFKIRERHGEPQGGDAGTAARFFYAAKASKADRAGSKHPTVKPIALIRWLVRLVTPPGGIVLDPFAGSGTTGAAAIAEGRIPILIEREAEYIEDIKRRLKADQRRIAKVA